MRARAPVQSGGQRACAGTGNLNALSTGSVYALLALSVALLFSTLGVVNSATASMRMGLPTGGGAGKSATANADGGCAAGVGVAGDEEQEYFDRQEIRVFHALAPPAVD